MDRRVILTMMAMVLLLLLPVPPAGAQTTTPPPPPPPETWPNMPEVPSYQWFTNDRAWKERVFNDATIQRDAISAGLGALWIAMEGQRMSECGPELDAMRVALDAVLERVMLLPTVSPLTGATQTPAASGGG